MEAYLWHTAKHTSFYPEEKRVPAVVDANSGEYRSAAKVLNDVLSESPFLVDGQFSVTDIFVGWAVNWGRRMGQNEGFDNLQSYLDRLFAREHCTLNPE